MSLRPLAVGFSAAANGRAIYIDRDTLLSYVWANKGVIVSEDPNHTIAGNQTTPADGIMPGMIWNSVAGISPIQLDFPLSGGKTIFVSLAAAGSTVLYFTDPV